MGFSDGLMGFQALKNKSKKTLLSSLYSRNTTPKPISTVPLSIQHSAWFRICLDCPFHSLCTCHLKSHIEGWHEQKSCVNKGQSKLGFIRKPWNYLECHVKFFIYLEERFPLQIFVRNEKVGHKKNQDAILKRYPW